MKILTLLSEATKNISW